MKLNALFGVWPYVALGLLMAGILLRYLLLRWHEAAASAEIAQARAVFAGARVWRMSLALLAGLHLIGAIFSRGILLWDRDPRRLYLLEGLAFLLGLLALAGLIVLIGKLVLGHGQTALSEIGDSILLALFFVAVSSGLVMAVLYRWGSAWGAMTLAPYTASLFRGRPAADLVTQLPFLVRLHVFASFAAIAVLPLSRLSIFLLAGLQKSVSWAGRPLSAAGRAAAAWLAKHNPAPWLWPEED